MKKQYMYYIQFMRHENFQDVTSAILFLKSTIAIQKFQDFVIVPYQLLLYMLHHHDVILATFNQKVYIWCIKIAPGYIIIHYWGIQNEFKRNSTRWRPLSRLSHWLHASDEVTTCHHPLQANVDPTFGLIQGLLGASRSYTNEIARIKICGWPVVYKMLENHIHWKFVWIKYAITHTHINYIIISKFHCTRTGGINGYVTPDGDPMPD